MFNFLKRFINLKVIKYKIDNSVRGKNITKQDIIVNELNIVYSEDEKMILELLNEKLEKLELFSFEKKISKLEKNEKNLLLKAIFYYKLEEFEKCKIILNILEEEFNSKILNNLIYLKLKYFLTLDEEIEKKIEVLSLEEYENISNYKLLVQEKYKEYLEKNEKSKKTALLKMFLEVQNCKSNNIEEIFTECIEFILKESNYEKLKLLFELIKILENTNKSLIKEKCYLLYIKEFENCYKLEEGIETKFEKRIVNLYILLKINYELKTLEEIKEIYNKYLKYLDSYNKIKLLLLDKKGYVKQIEESLKNGENSEIIFEILFMNRKYKKILKIYNFLGDEKNKTVELINIYSKIMLKKGINEFEENFLKNEQDLFSIFFYKTVLFFKKSISDDEYIKSSEEILKKHSSIDLIVEVIYNYKKNWIIDYILKTNEKREEFISALIKNLRTDYEIDGFNYDDIIEQIKDEKNIDYESIGRIYIEFKNLEQALFYLKKAMNKSKNINLAKTLLIVLINLKKTDLDVYSYLKENLKKDEIGYKIQNIIMLYFTNKMEAKIELNKLLLNLSQDEIKKNKEILAYIYFELILLNYNKNEIKYEYALYKNNNNKYIAEIYNPKKEFKILSEEKYINLSSNEIEDLTVYLMQGIAIKEKFFERPGITKIEFDKNNIDGFLEKVSQINGKAKFEKACEKYFSEESNQVLGLYNLPIDFIEMFIDKLIYHKSKRKKIENIKEKEKIFSLDSILFLYKIGKLECIKEKILILDNDLENLKEKTEIYKCLIEKKNFEVLSTKKINCIERCKEIKRFEVSQLEKIIYYIYKRRAIYITEDANLEISSYSSISLLN